MNEALSALRRFVAPVAHAHCELCAAPIATHHDHLLERRTRSLACACPACALLFEHAAGDRLRVRPRAHAVAAGRFDLAGWPTPIRLGWAWVKAGAPSLAYPGPAGVVDSPIGAETWARMMADTPALASLADDVEALLVDARGSEPRAFVVSIDRCFELAGVVRTGWRGLSGGTEVHRGIAAFFAGLERSP